MICLNCSQKDTQVKNSRSSAGTAQIWRRRACRHCGAVFTTYETPDSSTLKIVEPDEKKEDDFSLGNLTISIYKVLPNDNDRVTRDHALWLAKTIENKLVRRKSRRVLRSELKKLIYETLKDFDEMAAMQYGIKHGLISSLKRRGRPSFSLPD